MPLPMNEHKRKLHGKMASYSCAVNVHNCWVAEKCVCYCHSEVGIITYLPPAKMPEKKIVGV